jgi:hypothetical protein
MSNVLKVETANKVALETEKEQDTFEKTHTSKTHTHPSRCTGTGPVTGAPGPVVVGPPQNPGLGSQKPFHICTVPKETLFEVFPTKFSVLFSSHFIYVS